jgi:hypothetical protein
VCADSDDGTCTDWFLPSQDESIVMYTNLYNNGLGGFAATYYWRSSEYTADAAWSYNFKEDEQVNAWKGMTSLTAVRAVRAF